MTTAERAQVVHYIKQQAVKRMRAAPAISDALMWLAVDIELGRHMPQPLPRADAVVDSEPHRCPTVNDEGRCIYARGHRGGCDTENR